MISDLLHNTENYYGVNLWEMSNKKRFKDKVNICNINTILKNLQSLQVR